MKLTDLFRGSCTYFKPWIWALWRPWEYMNLVRIIFSLLIIIKLSVALFLISHGNSGVIDKILGVFVSEYFQLQLGTVFTDGEVTKEAGDLVTSVVRQFSPWNKFNICRGWSIYRLLTIFSKFTKNIHDLFLGNKEKFSLVKILRKMSFILRRQPRTWTCIVDTSPLGSVV